MKIVTIFAKVLYAVQYDKEQENEYDRLIDLWTDMIYLREFAKESNVADVEKLVKEVSEDVEAIDDFMQAVEDGEEEIDEIFKPLHNQETSIRELSL